MSIAMVARLERQRVAAVGAATARQAAIKVE